MAGTTESDGPAYISSHSADVILSDIRPIKLKIEALRAINVLLDEFLYSILTTARSLSTDKLRAGLLKVLPTSLGKEALLEAEVELRAYWDRTNPPGIPISPVGDDGKNFHIQWVFELLRLKCEAYSTLNESDEDLEAETRLNERMAQAGGISPPKQTLVAPAALYLTAILEAMCEHILSKVGRVASRDSSRTNATIQDLFVALCEDDSIYGMFKSMKVYEQIEQLSKTPKPRRSKSFSRTDKGISFSRTSSPHQDLSSAAKDAAFVPPQRSRLSSDASGMATVGTLPSSSSGSRSSFDKSRAMKMFMTNSRSSNDRDGEVQNGHKRSESALSDETKQSVAAYNESENPDYEPQDAALLQEFDDLMRSDSTMKVSLTPDRLKTMEVYKQEKDQRGNRRPPPPLFSPKAEPEPPAIIPSRANGRHPSLRHVDSIIEDEEEIFKSTPSPSLTARFTTPDIPPTLNSSPGNRVRSASAASLSSGSRSLLKKSSRTTVTPILSSPPTPPPVLSVPMTQNRELRLRKASDADPYPSRTRNIQRHRESIDLDDVMAGSDDEIPEPVAKPPSTPRRPGKFAVSASTRDLMDFLADGPPDDSLAEGPSTVESGKPKSSGRLQRMMSKLTMGNSEKSQSRSTGIVDDIPRTPRQPTLPNKLSANNLSALANRPIPPRPRPISPPDSPSQASSEDRTSSSARSRKPSATRRAIPAWEQNFEAQPPKISTVSKGEGQENGHSYQVPAFSQQPSNGHANSSTERINEQRTRVNVQRSPTIAAIAPVGRDPVTSTAASATEPSPSNRTTPRPTPVAIQTIIRKPVPAVLTNPQTSSPHISETDARDMRRLVSKATTADECRLILDMFFAKSGIPVEPTNYDVPYPSPSPSDSPPTQQSPTDINLEHSLVELFLGGDGEKDLVLAPRKRRSKKSTKPLNDVTVLPVEHRRHSDSGPAVAEPITETYTQVEEVGP